MVPAWTETCRSV